MVPHNVPLMNRKTKKDDKERYISIMDVEEKDGAQDYTDGATTKANSKEPVVGPRYKLVPRAATAKRNYEVANYRHDKSAENSRRMRVKSDMATDERK